MILTSSRLSVQMAEMEAGLQDDEAIQVSLVPEHSSVPQSCTTATRAVVSLKAKDAQDRSASLRLMLVLDTSASMAGDRMALVKATTK